MKREAPRQWLTLVLVILVTVGATLISAGAITGCCQKTGDGSGQTGAAAGGRQEPSASQSADVERILRWNLGSDPKTIDPQLNSASDGADIINNLYEGLMRESEGSLQPAGEALAPVGGGVQHHCGVFARHAGPRRGHAHDAEAAVIPETQQVLGGREPGAHVVHVRPGCLLNGGQQQA